MPHKRKSSSTPPHIANLPQYAHLSPNDLPDEEAVKKRRLDTKCKLLLNVPSSTTTSAISTSTTFLATTSATTLATTLATTSATTLATTSATTLATTLATTSATISTALATASATTSATTLAATLVTASLESVSASAANSTQQATQSQNIWKSKTLGFCCKNSKIQLALLEPPPPAILQLLTKLDINTGKRYVQKIRSYNFAFAFTFLGVNQNTSILEPDKPWVFKISGALYHNIAL
ncbi:19051_t:CDS:2 [Dentiscutata erythropus]|uniref:19051_t:CDS:1 n=1 Tax=Dentiscutata erythropus TaxID=1348616 RepID=A0A9N9NA31_9GLOM|nr:19051_t:CDS:2 [Dentiscutata erythropus]